MPKPRSGGRSSFGPRADNDAGDGVNPPTLVVVAEYKYDATGRRIEYAKYDETGALVGTTRYYYAGQSVIAEYDYTEPSGVPTEALARVYFNGSQYIDERVAMRDFTAVATGGDAADHYYMLQELYSVSGVIASNGRLEELITYAPYGDATIYEWVKGDFNRDGEVDNDGPGSDLYFFDDNDSGSGTQCTYPFTDLDLDGDADADDRSFLNPSYKQAKLTASKLGNEMLFTGRITDTWHASEERAYLDPDFRRSQWNRNRSYDPKHGRWLQRDPLGMRVDSARVMVNVSIQYNDGGNLYQYVLSSPAVMLDPSGFGTYEFDVFGPVFAHPAYDRAAHNKSTWDTWVADPDSGAQIQDLLTWLGQWALYGGSWLGGKVFPDANYHHSRAMMGHYIGNSGAPVTINLMEMIREDPGALDHMLDELSDAMTFVEDNLTEAITGKSFGIVDEPDGKTKTPDWMGAIGKYWSLSGGGNVKCLGFSPSGCPIIRMNWTHSILDNYDWELGSTGSVFGIPISLIAKGHYIGDAQFFPVNGSQSFQVQWTLGEWSRPTLGWGMATISPFIIPEFHSPDFESECTTVP